MGRTLELSLRVLARNSIDTKELIEDAAFVHLRTRVSSVGIVERVLAKAEDVELIATGDNDVIRAPTLRQQSVHVFVRHSVGMKEVLVSFHTKRLPFPVARTIILLNSLSVIVGTQLD